VFTAIFCSNDLMAFGAIRAIQDKGKSIPQQDKYSGKFVATYKGEVIASAKTSKKLFEKIKDKLGDKNLLIHHVDPKEAVCVY